MDVIYHVHDMQKDSVSTVSVGYSNYTTNVVDKRCLFLFIVKADEFIVEWSNYLHLGSEGICIANRQFISNLATFRYFLGKS